MLFLIFPGDRDEAGYVLGIGCGNGDREAWRRPKGSGEREPVLASDFGSGDRDGGLWRLPTGPGERELALALCGGGDREKLLR